MITYVARASSDLLQRATAEELTKTKWIKSVAKMSVSVLKDLIGQYEAWARAGGIRQSILGQDIPEDNERFDLLLLCIYSG